MAVGEESKSRTGKEASNAGDTAVGRAEGAGGRDYILSLEYRRGQLGRVLGCDTKLRLSFPENEDANQGRRWRCGLQPIEAADVSRILLPTPPSCA